MRGGGFTPASTSSAVWRVRSALEHSTRSIAPVPASKLSPMRRAAARPPPLRRRSLVVAAAPAQRPLLVVDALAAARFRVAQQVQAMHGPTSPASARRLVD